MTQPLDPGTPSFLLPDRQQTPDERNIRTLAEAGRALRDKVLGALNELFVQNTVNSAEAWYTGRDWHDGSEVWAKYITLGALPNAATSSVAHGLTTPTFVSIKGMADNGTNQEPIPSRNIGVHATGTDIVVTAAADYSTYTGWVIVEYLVTG